MDLSKLEKQIAKTGFVLENAIAEDLKAVGWTVISNRFYVDDNEDTVREIDLVAYRVSKIQHFNVYTSLIISCKKSEANAWALLCRDIDLKDPNSDWWPLHTWTNDKALQYQLGQQGAARKYHDDLRLLGVTQALQAPTVDVFAFQEMDRNTGAPHNDKPIFSAITSLMKAQSYELSAIPLRRKDPAIYQFNLLSIVDADLVRLKFGTGKVQATAIDSEHYIGRYIVRKRETFSRIRFINADHFRQCLPDYSRQHDANCKWFSDTCDTFYRNILTDYERRHVLAEEFRKALGWYLKWHLEKNQKDTIDVKGLTAEWSATKSSAAVTAWFSAAQVAFLNGSQEAVTRARKALKDVYRYDGAVVFDEEQDIPF